MIFNIQNISFHICCSKIRIMRDHLGSVHLLAHQNFPLDPPPHQSSPFQNFWPPPKKNIFSTKQILLKKSACISHLNQASKIKYFSKRREKFTFSIKTFTQPFQTFRTANRGFVQHPLHQLLLDYDITGRPARGASAAHCGKPGENFFRKIESIFESICRNRIQEQEKEERIAS